MIFDFYASIKSSKLRSGIVYISYLHLFSKMQSSSLQICIAFIVIAFFSVECSAEPTAAISTLPTASIDYTLDPPGPDLSDTVPFSAQTNSGFTIMGKLYHDTVDLYDYASIVHIANPDWTNQLRIYWIPGNQYRILIRVNSLDLDCAQDVPTSVFPVHNAWNSFTWRYDASTQSFEFKSNSQTVTKTCSVGALQNFDIKRARTLNMNWAGMRVYDSVLRDDEMASELNKICVSADTCADVLTAGCDTAPACPVPIAPVYSLPPTTKLAYPADNYNQLLTTPIQLQAEANGGFAVLGRFFFASSDVQPWDKLFQLRNFNLQSADALHLQIQMYQSDTAATYSFQIWKDGTSCQESFAKPATDNAWYTVEFQYSTVTDLWYLKLNDVLVAQTTCNAGWVENFQLNRVIVASQNWAGLRLYDSLLTDAEVDSDLDKICVPADTCADVLAAGCDSAPACSGAASTCTAIPPTSSFSFEEGLLDETGNAEIQKISGTGSTYVSDATHGQVLNVHNNAYRIDSPELGDVLDTESFTISLWVNLKEFESNGVLLSRYDWNVGTDNRGGFILFIDSKRIKLRQYYGPETTPNDVESNQELSALNVWYHIALVRTSSTEANFFINGNLDRSFTLDPAAKSMHTPINVIGLGAYCYGHTGEASGYKCVTYSSTAKYYYNDLRFYDFAASDTQVAAIANGGDVTACSSSYSEPTCQERVSVSYWSIRKSTC